MASTPVDFGALGWQDRDRDTAELTARREHLVARNGIIGLEVCDPDELDRAVRIFRRDGFVVVRDALDAEQVAFLRAGVREVAADIVALDDERNGNRGSHRYSFGGSSVTRSMLHRPEWQMLVDLPTVTPIVTAIFESSDHLLRAASGDFCLPGATEYQPLHADIGDWVSNEQTPFSSFHDPRGALTIRDLPCPYVAVNFMPDDQTALNGPTRQILGSQHSRAPIPTPADEPEWMRLRADRSTLSEHAQRLTRYSVVDSADELPSGYTVRALPKRLARR